MPTTAEYLQRLVQAKNDIATAITNKGGTVASGDGLEEFPNDIATIHTPVINPLTVTDNGTYTAPLFVDGYNPVVVNVPSVQPTLITKSITANGTYNASSDNADGYSTVDVDVPNTYTASDEGKVVSNGSLVSQTATSTNVNGTINTTLNNSVTVNVPTYSSADNGKVIQNGSLVSQTSASDSTINTNGTYDYDTTYNNSKKVIVAVPNTYTSGDEGKVVNNGALTSQTSTTKTANGTYDTTLNNEVVIAVPNTYTASDEGKVVNNGALVSQTSDTYTTNGTYDTTLINSVTVNVAGSTPTSGAFYKELTVGTTKPKLCIAIIGTKGSSGHICGAYNGAVATNPYDSFTLTDFTLSDYLSTSHTVQFTGRYQTSTIYYFNVTLNPTNNTVTFSGISGQISPTATSVKSTAFTEYSVL